MDAVPEASTKPEVPEDVVTLVVVGVVLPWRLGVSPRLLQAAI
jgi:hypothetical protein